jgi:hypothetical protein
VVVVVTGVTQKAADAVVLQDMGIHASMLVLWGAGVHGETFHAGMKHCPTHGLMGE